MSTQNSIFSPGAIRQRQTHVSQKWDKILSSSDAVLICCGEPLQKPGGLDQTYDFLPDPSYYWLSGSRRPGGVIFYSKDLGWRHFQVPISREEIIWEGANLNETLAEPLNALENLLKQNLFQKKIYLGQSGSLSTENSHLDLRHSLKIAMDQTRRKKDSEEVKLVRLAAEAAHKGYLKVQEILRAGLTERQLQIEYEAEIMRYGSHTTPYGSIVGSGVNAATLHAVPTQKKIASGDLILIDAGADIYDYCVDITRVFSADGKFSERQQIIYNLVKKAQAASIQECRPGVEWSFIHKTSARVIAQGLTELGLMKGSVDELLETGAISVFFPHGVGHLVGQRVRDVGHEENLHPKKHCGVFLRVDLTLEEDFMLTVEPGCYFIPALIHDQETRNKFGSYVNWIEAEKWLDLGGVRIEDDILITSAAPEVLTSLVKK